jgi:hypothetical protein
MVGIPDIERAALPSTRNVPSELVLVLTTDAAPELLEVFEVLGLAPS